MLLEVRTPFPPTSETQLPPTPYSPLPPYSKGESNMKCTFCGVPIMGYGNNPAPVRQKGKACDSCNLTIVIPVRFYAAHDDPRAKEIYDLHRGEEE